MIVCDFVPFSVTLSESMSVTVYIPRSKVIQRAEYLLWTVISSQIRFILTEDNGNSLPAVATTALDSIDQHASSTGSFTINKTTVEHSSRS